MSDPINPDHYKFNGVEVIQLTEQLGFLEGNVVKYVARAGRKQMDPLEDLRKARWYLDRLIRNVEGTPETTFHERIPTDEFGPFGVTDEQLEAALKPREFVYLNKEVPKDITVMDDNGDYWHWCNMHDEWESYSTGDMRLASGTTYVGPFTEVL